jgi:hypothetical protein
MEIQKVTEKFDEMLKELQSSKIVQKGDWGESIPQDIWDRYIKGSDCKTVAHDIDIDRHRWYETSITVIEIFGRYLGIRSITNIYSEMSGYDDFMWEIAFFEVESVQNGKAVIKGQEQTESKAPVIQEKDLELVITEKSLGSLTTNAKQIKALIEQMLPRYDIASYNDDNIEQAKKDKAALNKAAKLLTSKRIEVEKEFQKPFEEFKNTVTETVRLISECSQKIDTVVKQNEQIYKDKKEADIEEYFNSGNANLIDFRKVFNPSWLNKSASITSVKRDVDAVLARIDKDIKGLESFPEDKDVLVTFYKDSLNISNTIQYANRLRVQREMTKAAEEAKRKAEEEAERKAREALEKAQAATPVPSGQHISNITSDLFSGRPEASDDSAPVDNIQEQLPPAGTGNSSANEGLLTRAFTVTTTRNNIIALGNFMNDNGIDFDKIDLEETMCKTDMAAISGLLERSAKYIEENAGTSTRISDMARQCRLMVKKINKKYYETKA